MCIIVGGWVDLWVPVGGRAGVWVSGWVDACQCAWVDGWVLVGTERERVSQPGGKSAVAAKREFPAWFPWLGCL